MPEFAHEACPIVVGLLLPLVLPRNKFADIVAIAAGLGSLMSFAFGELAGSLDRSLAALFIDAGMCAASAAMVCVVRRLAQHRPEHK